MPHVTPSQLSAHITLLDRIGFSGNADLDNRADLVRFYGFNVNDASTIDESTMYAIIENNGHVESYTNEYGLTCSACGSSVRLEYADNPYDHYYTVCACGHSREISVYAIDEILSQREWEHVACDEVKQLRNGSWFVVGVPMSKMEAVRNGRHVQTIDVDTIEEYYELDGVYYRIENNTYAVMYKIREV